MNFDKVTGTNVCTRVLKKMAASRSMMSLGSRCNANSYCMLLIATHAKPCTNLSITYELLNNLHRKRCAQGYLSRGSTEGVACL